MQEPQIQPLPVVENLKGKRRTIFKVERWFALQSLHRRRLFMREGEFVKAGERGGYVR
jgi:hypothetical protein